ncbi:MAG: O-antigen ligase family protein [Bdellovibrionota bacterium]
MSKKTYVKASERNPTKHQTIEQSEPLSPLQWLICIFVVIMPLLFCKWNDQSPFEMIKAYFSAFSIAVIAGIFLVTRIFRDKIEIRYNNWVWGLLIYLAAYMLSFAFAGHYYSSLWGVLNLPAGSVMTVTTFVVMSLITVQIFSHEHSLKKLASCFVICAFLMSLYGILQHFGGDPIKWWVYASMEERALSTMGQSVGYGTVLGCCLPLCFAFFITSQNRKKAILWAIPFICMNLGILYSGSRLPILAYFIVMVIFLGFLAIFKRKLPTISWKRIGVAYLIIVLANVAYFTEPGFNSLKQKLEIQELKNGYGTRFIVWGTAFEMWKKHPILGVGPENFGEEFNHIQTVEQNYGESWNLIWHKAHNEFIHYLATTGVVGFGAYLWLIILMFIPVFRILFRKEQEWNADYVFAVALLGGFGYLLATHMTAFSFIPTLMFFYLFPAMNFSFANIEKTVTFENKLPKYGRWFAAGLVTVLATYIVYTVNGVWQADINYNDSRRQLVNYGNFDKASELLETAIRQNPGNAEYWCFRADIYYNFLVRSVRETGAAAEAKKRKFFDEVVRSSDTCVKMDDRKSDLWRARGTLFMSLSQMVPQMLEGSLASFKKAVEVYPNNPYNHISVAGVYRRKGRNDLAIQELNTAISLRRDIIPAYIDLLSIYYQDKRFKDIQDLINAVRALNIKDNIQFGPQMPVMIKLARDNNDLQTAKAFEDMMK